MLDSLVVVQTTVPARAAIYGLTHLFPSMMHSEPPLRKKFATPVGPLLPQNMPGYRASRKYKTIGDPIDTSIH